MFEEALYLLTIGATNSCIEIKRKNIGILDRINKK